MSSADSYKTLTTIWEKVSRPDPGGTKLIFFKTREDIVYLYSTGFVDEKKFTLLEWVAAFDESRQKDGTYLVTEAQWMDKVPYHYSGPIGYPFDPMALREGEWSEEEMQKLYTGKVLPAVYFTEEEMKKIWEEARPTFHSKDHYQVTKAFKQDLLNLIDNFPSPAQVRALGVREAYREKKGHPPPTGTGYVVGPAPSQVAAQRLADILSKTGGRK